MVAIEIALLTGRYHATPWGRHVNEGEVEWPPSPWRLLRALIATGFSKLGWRELPPAARSLFGALSAKPPVLALPSGSAAHTRHFMPPFKGNKVKVLDAFVDAGRGARLGVEWDVELSEAELDMLDALLARLSYLGRAESWVEARRIEGWAPGELSRCVAATSAPGPGYERVPLLAPLAEAAYHQWREVSLVAAREEALAEKRAAAQAKGKALPVKLSASDARKLASAYPPTLFDALRVDTRELQSAGWSQPPGSQWLSYWRHERVLAPPPCVSSRRAAPALPTTALLALSSDTKNGERLPLFTDAVLRLELLHKALVRQSDLGAGPSPSLTGKHEDGSRIDGHQHATLVPLRLESGEVASGDPKKRIDHILVYAPMGLDKRAQHALRSVRAVYGRGSKYFVSLVGLGARGELSENISSLSRSRVWVSSTPFVAPRHIKRAGKNTLLGQVLAELETRGLPRPARVEAELEEDRWLDLAAPPPNGARPASAWRHFRRARLDEGRQPPSPRGFGVRLSFDEPIEGPVTLGYASHFGLGAFEPER